MGAWGLGPFDNDTACDWGYELDEAIPSEVISARNRG